MVLVPQLPQSCGYKVNNSAHFAILHHSLMFIQVQMSVLSLSLSYPYIVFDSWISSTSRVEPTADLRNLWNANTHTHTHHTEGVAGERERKTLERNRENKANFKPKQEASEQATLADLSLRLRPPVLFISRLPTPGCLQWWPSDTKSLSYKEKRKAEEYGQMKFA